MVNLASAFGLVVLAPLAALAVDPQPVCDGLGPPANVSILPFANQIDIITMLMALALLLDRRRTSLHQLAPRSRIKDLRDGAMGLYNLLARPG